MKKLLILVAAVLLNGCASIVGERSQNVSIRTTPDQANFVIKDEDGTVVHRGTTPSTVNLPKKSGFFSGHDYAVELSKPGYDPRYANIESELSLWYLLGNIGFGGLIGWFIVDPLTGAMWVLDPEELNITLKQEKASPSGVAPPAEAPIVQPSAQATYGVHFASYENLDRAQRGWEEIWNKHWQLLPGTHPKIEYGSSADGNIQYRLYGRGLTKEQA